MARLRKIGVGLDDAEKIAGRRPVAQQEVGTGQEEEVQRVVLGEASEVEDLAKHPGRRRDLDAEQGVDRLAPPPGDAIPGTRRRCGW